ncbi:MAG: hypothetical protein DRH24_14210 [Deltaproteobacteria bacterium]|nr:MAG: hypothetical protein DRH24_14210 [Deltaproteobacteria bacterium]
MANTLTAFNSELWSAVAQEVIYKENVVLPIANTEFKAGLKKGMDVLHKPYPSAVLSAVDYTKGTDVTLQDIGATDEYVTIDQQKIVPFEVDDIDRIQNKYDAAAMYATMAGKALKNGLEHKVLSVMQSAAGLYIDDGDMPGGTAGNYISPSTSNINNIFLAAGRKLSNRLIGAANRVALIGPRLKEVLLDYLGGKDTEMADRVGENGVIGRRFGFDIIETQNLPFSAKWTPADNPSNGQTLTIAGVTFTFVSSLGSTAGNVLIGANTAATLDNLVAAINKSSGAGTKYVELAFKDRMILTQNGITATDGTSYITISGYGDISTATSVSADAWSLQRSHAIFCVRKAVDVVIQKDVTFEFRKPQLRLGRIVLAWMLYGAKVFHLNTDSIVDVRIDASDWTN